MWVTLIKQVGLNVIIPFCSIVCFLDLTSEASTTRPAGHLWPAQGFEVARVKLSTLVG